MRTTLNIDDDLVERASKMFSFGLMIDVSMTQLQSSVSRTRGANTKACELRFEDVGFTTAEPFDTHLDFLKNRQDEYGWAEAAGVGEKLKCMRLFQIIRRDG